jgi:hypothetical protein
MKRHAIAACLVLSVSGCAPDAWNNVQATGFNAFLNRIATECAPLHAGQFVITPNFQDPAWDQSTDDIYDQWLDQTSRLYYGRISAQTYVTNVGNFFGARSAQSAQCTITKTPGGALPPP